ncbi:MAG TPA: translation initiation factor IF-2, partial [Candidatus Caccocola faecipullorum]|nr:translation initiation factor IF-2 [Candidatus Caccocola faecipullorum]
MSKIRVYDLAKKLGKSNTEMVELLTGLGISIKSHMSSIDEGLVPMVEESLNRAQEEASRHEIEALSTYPTVAVKEGASVSDVASLAGEKAGSAVKALMMEGLMLPATTRADEKILQILGKTFKKNFVFASEAPAPVPAEEEPAPAETAQEAEEQPAEEPAPQPRVEAPKPVSHKKLKAKDKKKKGKQGGDGELQPRPPIITVMGHVDHGKTTLLDNIRKTHVTEKEAGGITQHIGASRVEYNGNTLVFLDTPGHEAFTSMRARGAQVTDIAVLVVAADDGIKPQTVEALNHAKAAGVPIVVAVNKIDKPEAKPERVRQQLSDYGLIPEEWGGDTIMVDVAAKKGLHVDDLLEMLLLVAEMQELKANPKAAPTGTVIEANLDKGKGPVATVIVQDGTLRRGDIIHTGSAWGKIRAMIDDKGRNVNEAGPSMPVEVLGLESVPQPGEKFTTLSSEREARELMSQSEFERRETDQSKAKRLTLEELYEKMQTEEVPQLRIVLKTDVQGSLEAFHSSLMKMSTDAVSINIVHEGVGRISESDVMLASASNAIIVGFNVRPDSNAKKIAENEGVQIRLYQVIYDMLDDVKAAMEGMLAPELREHTLGQAEIREIFRVPKVGNIAGCRVTEGLIRRSAKVRLIRDGVVFWSGELSSLKHFKDDVREIKAGNECGL